MLKAYEFRIYPTKEQENIFNQTLGLCRLYWNIVVANKNENHDMLIQGYKPIFEKYKPEALQWAKEAACSIPLAQMWSDVRAAYTNFFKRSCKGQRKGKFTQPPKFKSKKNPKDSFRYSCSNCNPKIDENGLFLTNKLGHIDIRAHRFAQGKWKNITFRRTATGKWFVKICVDKKDELKNKNGKSVGIDWNCRDEDFLVMSDGTKVKCPRFLQKSSKQLKHQQKIMSKRFIKGLETQSSNYYKQKQKVALLHEKVAWQRKDWLHKLSRQICNEYETVVVEDINLQTMSKMNHGKVVGDQGFGMLRTMIVYKGNLVKVSPKNTSKTCHCCGFVNPEVKVGVNYWECPNCSAKHDRDINAALNILRKGIVGRELAESTNACGAPSSAEKQESPNSLQITA